MICDIDKDPLHDYIRVKTTSSRKGDIIAYHDSIYIEYLQHDYRAERAFGNGELQEYHLS